MTKLTKIASLSDKDHEMFVVDFDGEPRFFSIDEVEQHLESYFKIRENLRREKRLRNEIPMLKEKWNEYQFALTLAKDYKE